MVKKKESKIYFYLIDHSIYCNININFSQLEYGVEMKNKMGTTILLLATAIASGYALYSLLKMTGLADTFDFDLSEDIDEDDQL
jgi:hypothetical protein